MRALLDTNIIIQRESNKIFNQDIGVLFKWLDKAKYEKCVHPITIEEINKNKNKDTVEVFNVKLESYTSLKTTAPIAPEVSTVSNSLDKNKNDINDTYLLNEVFCDRVDILITEDKNIHKKSELLSVSDRVFSIDSFLEKVVSEFPDLVDYNVLSVSKKYFGDINLKDSFFDSFREDYHSFNDWFNKKADETAYVTHNRGRILSFLYVKIENIEENYFDISPKFKPKKRLKIGTFKVISNGVKLGERFLKIIFDNALKNHVDEIYVTIFEKRFEQTRLINLLKEWGFKKHGRKTSRSGEELVFVRDFRPSFYLEDPKITFPYFSANSSTFLVPIKPVYHTDLLPDSFLRTESPLNYTENQPHRNALSKSYISRSIERNVKRGDTIVFYRTGEEGKAAYYSAVITTIAIVEDKIDNIKSEQEFILRSRKRSVFTDDQLIVEWNGGKYRPFIINFLYSYSFELGRRINRKKLLDLNILTGEKNELRGLKWIPKESLLKIINEAVSDESIVIN